MKSLNAFWESVKKSPEMNKTLQLAEILSVTYQNSPHCNTIGGLPEGFLESISFDDLEIIATSMLFLPTFEMEPEFSEPFRTNGINREIFFEAANISTAVDAIWDCAKDGSKPKFL